MVYLLPVIVLSGCKKDFLERPPTDAIVDANFYKTDEQVLAGTASLYSKVWFDYNDKAYFNLGDFRAGTAFSAYNERGNVLFNTTDITPENDAAWRHSLLWLVSLTLPSLILTGMQVPVFQQQLKKWLLPKQDL